MMGTWLTSCVYDEVPEVDGKKEYGICLSLITATPSASRATEITEEIGSDNENKIDIAGGDFRVLLFAGSDDNAKLVAAPDFNVEIKADDYTEYMVWAKLPDTFFESNGINPDKLQVYQLMVLANWNSLKASYRSMIPGMTTVNDVKSYSGRLMKDHNPEGWSPFENGNKGIPMYGLLKFSKRQSDLELNIGTNGKFESNVQTLYLLRAMAKLEIIDRTAEFIDNPDKSLNPWIESVRVDYYNQNGYAIPSQFINGEQVIEATIPIDTYQGENLKGEVYVNSEEGVYNLNKKDKLFCAYLMEQSQNNLYLRFYVKKRNQNGVIETKDFYLRVSDMIEQQAYKSAFLRNHIYRIYVTLDIKAQIKLYYVVCPWDGKNIDIPTFD